MKVLRVSKQPPSQLEVSTLEQYGVIIRHTSPTLLSAVTAMRIAKLVDRHDIDIVTVSEQPDAVAALSARKIADNRRFKVIYAPAPNTDGPRTIHREVAEGVDGWIFVSGRQRDTFKGALRRCTVITPVSFDVPEIAEPDLTTRPVTIAWIGDITDAEKLKEIVEIIDNLDAEAILRVSGAGRARDVMPVVRYARAMIHPGRVVWVGEEYNKAHEIEACQCAVRTGRDLTIAESEILMSGRAVIEPDQIKDMAEAPHKADLCPTLQQYIITLRQYYTSVINEAQQ